MEQTQPKEECREYVVSGWHLKKEVTIGQLVTIVALLISGLWWASSVETRMVHINGEIKRVEQKSEIQNKTVIGLLNRIDRKLNKMDDKLDRKADKP